MPTTCGFPNCKFRSRYRGQEDNRHFYRIPKRPHILRQSWLQAIGRTEETVVSQLRICSAHFMGGEKKEGDVPVPDPTIDKQINIELPPKESKNSERRRAKSISDVLNRLARNNYYVPNMPNILKNLGASKKQHNNCGPLVNIDGLAIIAVIGAEQSIVEESVLQNSRIKFNKQTWGHLRVQAFNFQSDIDISEEVIEQTSAIILISEGPFRLTRETIQKFKNLQIVVKTNQKYDNIDVSAATEKGILVSTVSIDSTNEIADTTMTMILELNRRVMYFNNRMQRGEKVLTYEHLGRIGYGMRPLQGQQLGLIGFNRISLAVAQRARCFGINVVYWDPYEKDTKEITRISVLTDLFETCDIISLHCGLDAATKFIINNNNLEHCKLGAIIINTSHGQLINEKHLNKYIENGRILGAALDVHESKLFELDSHNNHFNIGRNVIQTPQMAWYTESGAKELRRLAVEEVIKCLLGEPLQYCINRQDIEQALCPSVQNSSSASSANSHNLNLEPTQTNLIVAQIWQQIAFNQLTSAANNIQSIIPSQGPSVPIPANANTPALGSQFNPLFSNSFLTMEQIQQAQILYAQIFLRENQRVQQEQSKRQRQLQHAQKTKYARENKKTFTDSLAMLTTMNTSLSNINKLDSAQSMLASLSSQISHPSSTPSPITQQLPSPPINTSQKDSINLSVEQLQDMQMEITSDCNDIKSTESSSNCLAPTDLQSIHDDSSSNQSMPVFFRQILTETLNAVAAKENSTEGEPSNVTNYDSS